MKYDELFYPVEKGDFGLTDEMAYSSIVLEGEFIPLYGGNDSHEVASRWVREGCLAKTGKRITVFEGPGIVLSLDGSAGSMTFKREGRFALNHHAGFLKLKPSARKKCDLRYFALFMQNQLRHLAVSDGSKTLSLAQLYGYEFDLPPFSIQQDLLSAVKRYDKAFESLLAFHESTTDVLSRSLAAEYSQYQVENVPVSELFCCMSGNSGLTEEVIYLHSGDSGKRYQVLSGATLERNMLGSIPRCSIPIGGGREKALQVFEDKEGLLVVRKGKAGRMSYLPKGDYTINDDAYILSVKNECPYEIDLRWFSIACRAIVLSYASTSDNGTWNKTGFFQSALVSIPAIEEQKALVSAVEKAQRIRAKAQTVQERFDALLNLELVV